EKGKKRAARETEERKGKSERREKRGNEKGKKRAAREMEERKRQKASGGRNGGTKRQKTSGERRNGSSSSPLVKVLSGAVPHFSN
ncbi:MAG: hypothetical protein SOR67_08385, partial [Alloprevotella sp.]|nr:hypothetical protein [Alloprevotella sp.]